MSIIDNPRGQVFPVYFDADDDPCGEISNDNDECEFTFQARCHGPDITYQQLTEIASKICELNS